jgi:uncharacterized protein (DUF2164 family)
MVYIFNFKDFWDESKRVYANFYNQQIEDAIDAIDPENLGKAIQDVENIIAQTKIENELISDE